MGACITCGPIYLGPGIASDAASRDVAIAAGEWRSCCGGSRVMRLRPSVLAIDDDPGVLGVLQGALGHRYGVVTARTAAGGLELLEAEPIDVVVLDLLLPDLDGL